MRATTCGADELTAAYGQDYFYTAHGLMLGESYLGRRVHDVLCALDVLVAAGTREIRLSGRGLGAILAAFAGLLHPRVRRVALKPEWHRGGVLTHASVLKVTANGTTTSPVLRGVWLMDRILGQPAPPPPPNVPAVEPDIRGATTIKEQLAKHRDTAACASCHRKIDPLGFALESFDVIGGWREKYRALSEPTPKARAKLIDGQPVNPADEWAGVGRFSSFQEFRELVKKREDLVIQNLTHKLATFTLGRQPGFADRAPLQAIAAKSRKDQSGMSTLVLDLIISPVFTQP